MPPFQLRRGPARAVAALAVAALALAGSAPGRAQPAKSTVIMLKTEPDINEKTLNRQLKIAVTESGCKCSNLEKLEAEPISQGDYEAVERFMTGVRAKPAKGAAPPRAEIVMRQKPVLIITKANEKDSLESVEVVYHSGKKEEAKVTPRGKGGKLTPFTNNDYQFELAEGEYPRAFTAHYEGQKPVTEEIGGARYFSVVLENFEGKLEDLQAKFRDKNIFSDTATVNVTNQQTFVLANFAGDEVREPGVTVYEDQVVFQAEQREPGTNRRVWVHFPLKKDDVEDLKKGENSFAKFRRMDQYELSDQIRKSAPVLDGAAHTVGPKSVPQWLELAKVNGRNFERIIKLEDAANLRKTFPDAYYLIVWEFDPDPMKPFLRSAFGLREKDPAGGKAKKVYVTARKIEGWADGLMKPAPKGPKEDPKP